MRTIAAPVLVLGVVGSLAACLLPSYEIVEGTGGAGVGASGASGGGPATGGGASGGAGGAEGGARPGCLGDGLGPTLGWTVRLSGEGTRYQSDSAVGPAGEVFVIGSMDGTLVANGDTYSSDGPDPFLVRITPAGTIDWVKVYQAPDAQFGLAVAADGSGDPYIGGTFLGTSFQLGQDTLSEAEGFAGWTARLDSDGTPNRAYAFKGADDQGIWALNAASGSLFLAGINVGGMAISGENLMSAGFEDLAVSRLFAGASDNWAIGLGDDQPQIVRDMAYDGGKLFLVGRTGGPGPFDADTSCPAPAGDDAFLFVVTADGDLTEAHCWGGAEDQEAHGVKVLPDGKLLVVGGFFGTIDFGDGQHTAGGGSDAFVALLNADGTAVWTQVIAGAGDQRANAATVDEAGDVWIVGQSVGTLTLQGVEYEGAGDQDAFVVQLGSDGEPKWARLFGSVGDQALGRVFTTPDGELVTSGTFSNDVDVCGDELTGGGDDTVVLRFQP